MAEPVLLRDLLPAVLLKLHPVSVHTTGRAAQPPVRPSTHPPRREGLSQVMARVDEAARR